MKKFFLVFSLLYILSVHAADELGRAMFITAPKDKPMFDTNPTNSNGMRLRYWPCNGYVNRKLLDVIHAELVVLSNEEGIQSPEINSCLYTISSESSPNSFIGYTVNMYASIATMDSCMRNPSRGCDTRSASFVLSKDGSEVMRQYYLVDTKKMISRAGCVSMKGQVIKAKDLCD
jgi:hypothetical protein